MFTTPSQPSFNRVGRHYILNGPPPVGDINPHLSFEDESCVVIQSAKIMNVDYMYCLRLLNLPETHDELHHLHFLGVHILDPEDYGFARWDGPHDDENKEDVKEGWRTDEKEEAKEDVKEELRKEEKAEESDDGADEKKESEMVESQPRVKGLDYILTGLGEVNLISLTLSLFNFSKWMSLWPSITTVRNLNLWTPIGTETRHDHVLAALGYVMNWRLIRSYVSYVVDGGIIIHQYRSRLYKQTDILQSCVKTHHITDALWPIVASYCSHV